jgi:hypothetical protein
MKRCSATPRVVKFFEVNLSFSLYLSLSLLSTLCLAHASQVQLELFYTVATGNQQSNVQSLRPGSRGAASLSSGVASGKSVGSSPMVSQQVKHSRLFLGPHNRQVVQVEYSLVVPQQAMFDLACRSAMREETLTIFVSHSSTHCNAPIAVRALYLSLLLSDCQICVSFSLTARYAYSFSRSRIPMTYRG